MKRFFVTAFTLIMLGGFVAIPLVQANHESGKPFEEIWQAINALKEQIANIKLLPGPQGPPGPQGEQGEQGPPGPPGSSGEGGGITKNSLYLKDAFTTAFPGPAVEAVAYCDDDNDVLLSGGFWREHSNIEIFSSYPRPFNALANWVVAAAANPGTSGLVQATAVCLSVP